MKTTNSLRMLGRILLQATVPVILMYVFFFAMLKLVSEDRTQEQYINMLSENWITNVAIVIVSIMFLFACWFHFVSPHRFTNRKPKGLYREYITWFLREE